MPKSMSRYRTSGARVAPSHLHVGGEPTDVSRTARGDEDGEEVAEGVGCKHSCTPGGGHGCGCGRARKRTGVTERMGDFYRNQAAHIIWVNEVTDVTQAIPSDPAIGYDGQDVQRPNTWNKISYVMGGSQTIMPEQKRNCHMVVVLVVVVVLTGTA
ncbi:hypothetical protein C8Q76DRAFT_698512 [Earliella scabrosa]|nr:hypothetical protein C8Q76DRAFT_698512 [Earliella scabrosa]